MKDNRAENYIKKYGLKKFKENYPHHSANSNDLENYFDLIGYKVNKSKREFFSRQISKNYFITHKDIISIFNNSNWKTNKFNNLQLIQIIHIRDELVKHFSTEKKNLSVKLATNWVISNNIEFEIFIIKFKHLLSSLQTRKKGSKRLNTFIDKLEQSYNKISVKDNSLTFNKKSIKDFMRALIDLKSTHISGTNEAFLKMIFENIETGYSIKSLNNYYYTL